MSSLPAEKPATSTGENKTAQRDVPAQVDAVIPPEEKGFRGKINWLRSRNGYFWLSLIIYTLCTLALLTLFLYNIPWAGFSFLSFLSFSSLNPNLFSLGILLLFPILRRLKRSSENSFPSKREGIDIILIALIILIISLLSLVKSLGPLLPALPIVMLGIVFVRKTILPTEWYKKKQKGIDPSPPSAFYKWISRGLYCLVSSALIAIVVYNLGLPFLSFLSFSPFLNPNFLSLGALLLFPFLDAFKAIDGKKISYPKTRWTIYILILIAGVLGIYFLSDISSRLLSLSFLSPVLPVLPVIMLGVLFMRRGIPLFYKVYKNYMEPDQDKFLTTKIQDVPSDLPSARQTKDTFMPKEGKITDLQGVPCEVKTIDTDSEGGIVEFSEIKGTWTSGASKVDLRVHPTVLEQKEAKRDICLGDLHGNFLKLIHHLIKEGVLKLANKEDYPALVEIHKQVVISGYEAATGRTCAEKKSDALAVKENLEKFKDILSKATLQIDKVRMITLLGDTVADRAGNDKFMIAVFEKLHKKGVQFEIPAANHDGWLIEASETNFENFNFPQTIGIAYQGMSLPNAFSVYNEQDAKDISPADKDSFNEDINNYYKPHLKVLSYKLNKKKDHIIALTHAPIPPLQLPYIINNIARKMELTDYTLSTPEKVAKTIDKINEVFQKKYVQTNTAHELFKIVKLPAGLFKCDEDGNILIPHINLEDIRLSSNPNGFLERESIMRTAELLNIEPDPEETMWTLINKINCKFAERGQKYWEEEFSVFLLMWNRLPPAPGSVVMPERSKPFNDSCQIQSSIHGHIGNSQTIGGYCNLDNSLGRVQFSDDQLFFVSQGVYKTFAASAEHFDITETLIMPDKVEKEIKATQSPSFGSIPEVTAALNGTITPQPSPRTSLTSGPTPLAPLSPTNTPPTLNLMKQPTPLLAQDSDLTSLAQESVLTPP